MTGPEQAIIPLATVALGDIVTLPDGRDFTARARVSLRHPVGSMAGFVIVGELEVLLSLPPSVTAPINVYVPTPRIPEYAQGGRSRCVEEGATRYWAPHLPAAGGAMGELLWRVLEVRGRIDPIVLVYRGSELIVFVKASHAWPIDLRVDAMDRGVDNELPVTRYAAVVVGEPATADPSQIPVHEPVPAHRGARHQAPGRGR